MSTKSPTFTRYQRVEAILESDRAILSKLGPKTEIVCRPAPSNEKVKFSKPVVYITEAIHKEGLDAQSTGKNEILKRAVDLMDDTGKIRLPESELSPVLATQSAEDKPTPAAAPPAAVKPPKKVVATVKAVPRKKAEKPAPVKSTAKETVVKEPPVAAETEEDDDENSLREDTPAMRVLKPNFPTCWGVSAVTMLLAIDQLTDMLDSGPGKRERQRKIADLLADFQAITIMPKESKKDAGKPDA